MSVLALTAPGIWTMRWPMLPHVPLVHQRHEAIADLMDALRDAGLVLTADPRISIQHGAAPLMTIRAAARHADPAEAADLSHQKEI